MNNLTCKLPFRTQHRAMKRQRPQLFPTRVPRALGTQVSHMRYLAEHNKQWTRVACLISLFCKGPRAGARIKVLALMQQE